MRYVYLSAILAAILILGWAGIRGTRFGLPPLEVFPDMDRQEKVKYQKPSSFFANGSGARMPVPGTMPVGFEMPVKPAAQGAAAAFGFTHGADYFNSGSFGDYYGDGMPEEVDVDAAFLERGRQRYNINCAICHGRAGDGKGALSNYWLTPIANFHEERLRDRAQTPDGSIFQTITLGKGLMGPYGGNVTVRDRWAIVAYVRTLQKTNWGSVPAEAGGATN